MLKVFYLLLSLGISQSLAVISNAQQDLAVKPIVYKPPANLYLPSNLPSSKNEPQYQPLGQEYTAASSYNGPSHQYLPTTMKQEINTTPSSNSQYQPTFTQNALSSNYNQYSTSSSIREDSTSNVHTAPQNELSQYQSTSTNSLASNYQGSSHPHSPSSSKQGIQNGLSQYQPSSAQNSQSTNYNGPSKQEITSAPGSQRPFPTQNGLSQYQPASAPNYTPSNYQGSTNKNQQQEITSVPSSERPTTTQNGFSQHQPSSAQSSQSSYNEGPSNQYSPTYSSPEITSVPSSQRPIPTQNGFSQNQPSLSHNSLPSNYQGSSHQYSPTSSKQDITSNIQNQPSAAQNSQSSYNQGPSNQYSPSSSNQELTSVPTSHRPSPSQNGFSQYQPSTAQHHQPKQEVTTTPRTNVPSPPATYYRPAHQYLPATTELPQTSTPLNISNENQNPANYPFNHNNHWSPIKDHRQHQQIITDNLKPNEQPPVELHHGYRYIEPAQKINHTHFQPISEVKYNELGLGQNDTNTSVTSETRPSKTEIQTHQGYVYGQHYPNTTVLRPVETPDSSFDSQQQNHNRFVAHNSYNNTEEKQPSNTISAQEQYPNHRYPNSVNNEQPLYPSSSTTSTEHTSQHSNTQPTGQQTSSQSGSFSHKVNLIANSNNIAAHRFTTEVTQEMAAEIYPHLYPNVQTVANQYHSSGNQVSSQQNSLNYEPSKGASSYFNKNIPTPTNYIDQPSNKNPQLVKPSANNQQFSQSASQTRPLSERPNVQTQNNQFVTESNHYASQSLAQTSSSSGLSSTITSSNNVVNGQSQSSFPTSNPTNQQQQNLHYNQQYSTNNQQPIQEPLTPTTSNSRPNFPNQANQFASSLHTTQSHYFKPNFQTQTSTQQVTYPANQNHQPSPVSNSRPNVQTQTSTQQETYPANQNQEPAPTSSNRPNVPTQTLTQQAHYPTNQNQQPSQTFNFNPNSPTQTSQQQATYPINQNQQPSLASNSRPNVQTQTSTQQATHPANQNQQPSQTSNNRPNVPNQQQTYPTYQNQQPSSVSNSRPNIPTQTSTQQATYPVNQNQQYSQSMVIRPNIPTQTSTQQATYPANQNQQPFNSKPNAQTPATSQQPIHPTYQNQQNTGTNYIQTPSSSPTQNVQNGYYSSNPQQSYAAPTNSIRPNAQTESNPMHTALNSQQQPQVAATKPSVQPESPYYYYNSPQQPNRMSLLSSSSNTRPIRPTETQQFFPNTPPQLEQGLDTPKSSLESHIIAPISQAQSQQSALSFPQTSLISTNVTLPLTETPRYTPAKQNLYQNQQYFLAKPTQTSQVASATTVGNFFGQTSATSASTSVSVNNNGNVNQQSLQQKPLDLMGNSNYLQMQSHSFEMPYYYTMLMANKQSQPSMESARPTLRIAAPATVPETVRVPHLIYGAPINEPSHTYLPPSLVMQAPYF